MIETPLAEGTDSQIVSDRVKFQALVNSLKAYEEFLLDANGRIISCNLGAVTITGYEEWEVQQRHIALFYTLEEQRKNKAHTDLQKTTKLGKYISSGFRLKKRGDLFWAKMKYFAIRMNGEVAGYRVQLFDTSHRAMYSMSTKRIKDEYVSLFNNSFIGILKFGLRDYTFLRLNEKALQIFRRERELLKISDVFYYESEFAEFVKKISTLRHVDNFEFRLNHPQREIYCSLSCKVFPLGGFVEGVVSDITEKRNQILQLEKLNKELDNFLYHASHDIRAPLATILGLVNLIKTDNSLENMLEYTHRIEGRVKHLDSLLKDLSNVFFNNSQPLHKELISPQKLFHDIIGVFAREYPKTEISLEFHSEVPFYSDVVRVTTILKNILSNAFRYSNPAAEKHTVKVDYACDKYTAVIRVEDNGCGIDPQYLKDIFKLFFKMDSGGRGLGLYLVQISLEKLNGKIDMKSDIGAGTCVTVTIPNCLSNHNP